MNYSKLLGIVFALGGMRALAVLEVSQLFSDHMVMQRGMPVPVWGWASPEEKVTVSIGQQTKTAHADRAGKWLVRLDPMEPGAPRNMTVEGLAETVAVQDILLGEVWVCSGQSNMEWPLSAALHGKDEVAAADHPEIRLFEVGTGTTPEGPVERLKASPERKCIWQACSSSSAARFSAVGYFFGRDLQKALQVPVGLIYNAVGATPAEAWISRDALQSDPDLRFLIERWDRRLAYARTPAGRGELDQVFAEYDARQKEARAKGGWFWRSDAYQEPLKQLGYPGTFFNGRVHPLIPYAIRGVIWYQGEANTGMAHAYRSLFPALIKDWRSRWGQGEFPFLYVQLANWGGLSPQEPGPSDWAELRESQLLALRVTNTAMAVAIDIGEAEDIHPKNKQDVGRRLALAARAMVYREPVVHSGPIYRAMSVEGSSIRLHFDHIGGGLQARDGALKHFTIAPDSRKFVWAEAAIDGDTVVVHSDSVTNPVAVRYAWAVNPKGCNLYNKEGLPASPFRTDDWPGLTTAKDYRSQLDEPIAFRIKR